MKPPYYIETLARNGEVLQRQQVAALPIRLGRAYDNDVILDDAHAGAQHAVIDAYSDEHLLLHDLGSQNGTIHQGKRRSSVILGGDTVVRLGHTRLRVRAASHPVPPEVADTTMHGWEGAAPAIVGLGLIGAIAAVSTWLSDTAAFDAVRYLLVIAYALGGGLLWGALWAFGNRLFGHHARLGRHLFILGCAMAAMEVALILGSMAAYAYSFEALTRYGSHVLIALGCGMIFFHLRTVKPRHPRRLAAICLALMVLVSSLTLMGNLQSHGRLADEPYMAVLLPPLLRISADHTPEQFLASAAALKAEVDAARLKGPGGDAIDDDGDEQQ